MTLGLGGNQAEKAETPAQGPGDSVGVLAAAVILFIAFGSLVAMGLPIVTGLMAVLGGIALIEARRPSRASPDFTVLVAALIGLGVGIDYALFIVTRYKDNLQNGDDPETATVNAITTAGRAVLFAGTTVVIAMLGLVAMGQKLMTGVAIGASATVLVTMIAAVTLLPAFLGFTGTESTRCGCPAARPASARRRRPGPAPYRRRTLGRRSAAQAVGRRGTGRRGACWCWPPPRCRCASACPTPACRPTTGAATARTRSSPRASVPATARR